MIPEGTARRAALAAFLAVVGAWVAFSFLGTLTIPKLYAAQAAGFEGGVWRGGPEPALHSVAVAGLAAAFFGIAVLLCALLAQRRGVPHTPSPKLLRGLLVLAFLALASTFWDFVVDDAYITFRFGQNLALGNGLVWNAGEAPVEGFTSFLAMLISAFAQWIHFDAVAAAKLSCLAAGCATILVVDRHAAALPWSLRLMLASGVALSPAFAFHALHGMETALAAALTAVTAAACLCLLDEGCRTAAIVAPVAALLAFLARPDTAACTAVCLLGSAALLAARRRSEALLRFGTAAALAALAWAGFMLWRKAYFGAWLPNTFQVKVARAAGLFQAGGARYALEALLGPCLPFVALALAILIFGACAKHRTEALPLLLGVAAFGIYLCTIVPIQGFLARFAYPAVPVLLLATAHLARGSSLARALEARPLRAAAVVLLFCVWSARQLPAAIDLKEDRTQHDRVLAGERLAGIPGTMVASESGALPYLSGWKSVDTLGLVSAEIAGDGLTALQLERRNPDLVMLSNRGKYRPQGAVHAYMTAHGFAPLAAVHKSRGMYHYYFVRTDSPSAARIRTALLGIPGLRYGDLAQLFAAERE